MTRSFNCFPGRFVLNLEIKVWSIPILEILEVADRFAKIQTVLYPPSITIIQIHVY